ncbi:MAG: MBL fold metallo-hydrolase [Gillisia sp.]
MKKLFFLFLTIGSLASCKNIKEDRGQTDRLDQENVMNTNSNQEIDKDSVPVMPVSHASFVMELNKKILYFDPVGNDSLYSHLPKPDMIFLTDIHPDHMDAKTLMGLMNKDVVIIAPQAVKDKLPAELQAKIHVMENDDTKAYFDINITAIPMYNIRDTAKQFHPKGRGNGYLLTYGKHTIYVAGDTEDTPEMRALKNVDIAFIPMNLPYTMPVDKAVDAVLEFKPKKVYPYHYRGQDGYSDVEKFKREVESKDSDIKVQLLNWYPNREKE